MNKPAITFALIGSIITILFFYIVNSLTSSNYIWFVYPVFAVIWWPLSMYCHSKNNFKAFSIVGSILIIIFLIMTNYITSSNHPWFLYAVFPVIWWPITMYSGKIAGTVKYALIVSICTILYYSILNILISPQYPWMIYPTYTVLWWPISLFYSRRRQFFELSVAGCTLTILFFIIVNLVSSPHTIWAIYPAFGIIWWPLSMYYFSSNQKHVRN
jgi:hypothetical protein